MRGDKAYRIGQRFINPINKEKWVLVYSSWNAHTKDWDYKLVLANSHPTKSTKIIPLKNLQSSINKGKLKLD